MKTRTREGDAAPADVRPVTASIREGDEALGQRLGEAHRLITKYPLVTRAFIGAFAAEGRTYSQTPDGRRLREALLRSPYLKRARIVWNAFGLDDHADAPSAFVPSWWVGTLIAAASSERLEQVLSRLLLDERGDPT